MGQAIDVMDSQVTHITGLLDDLLDVARITTGRIRLQLRATDLRRVIAAALENVRSRIGQCGLGLEIDLAGEPCLVRGDPARLTQVADNLLDNAIKYTPRGGKVRVSLQVRGTETILEVQDSGIGIEAQALARVFDLFGQADRALDRAQGGLGIGLTLVRRLVEMQGGTVRVESPGKDRGTTFRVVLPLLSEGDDTGHPEPACVEHRPRRVLVVEDNQDAAHALSGLLRALGHTVHCACNGLDALVAVEEFGPEIALVDIGLPEIDGYEVARRLRRRAPRVRLVALSGYGQKEDRRRARDAGFERHLTKPADVDTLIRTLRAVD